MNDRDPEICLTCNNSRAWHQHNKPNHPFNDGSLPVSATFGKRRSDGSRGPTPTSQGQSQGHQPPDPAPWPFDPVLRMALINKGVLTPDDLRAAEESIRAATATFHRGDVNGQ